MLKSYVKIKYEILCVKNIFKAQYLEFEFYTTFSHYFMNSSVINTELLYYEFQFKNYKNF